MPVERLLIVGAGSYGRSVAEAAMLSGQYKVVGFVDDLVTIGSGFLDISVLGITNDLKAYVTLCDKVIVAIGNNSLRKSLTDQLIKIGFNLTSIVHPKAFVSPSATVGIGSSIMAGAIVGTQAQIGIGVIINSGAIVDHHARACDFSHLGVNAAIAGGSVLGLSAWMQAGCTLGYNVEVPSGSVLMPGTVLK